MFEGKYRNFIAVKDQENEQTVNTVRPEAWLRAVFPVSLRRGQHLPSVKIKSAVWYRFISEVLTGRLKQLRRRLGH